MYKRRSPERKEERKSIDGYLGIMEENGHRDLAYDLTANSKYIHISERTNMLEAARDSGRLTLVPWHELWGFVCMDPPARSRRETDGGGGELSR